MRTQTHRPHQVRSRTTGARHAAAGCLFGALLLIPALAQAEWTNTQGVNHFCSGVSLESRADMTSAGDANAKIMLTAGANGQYLSDVQLTVSGGGLSQPASFQSEGPICLLKLPAGRYRIEAEHEGQRRTGALNVPAAQSSNPPSLMFNFPAD